MKYRPGGKQYYWGKLATASPLNGELAALQFAEAWANELESRMGTGAFRDIQWQAAKAAFFDTSAVMPIRVSYLIKMVAMVFGAAWCISYAERLLEGV